ncbi:MAG: hypothetical protein LAN62_14360 [Acidobacteriia bacterium]|nr:hypothetical protein [Terriglobia bacterium]
MNLKKSYAATAVLVGVALFATWALSRAQSEPAEPQASPKVSAEQQKQLDQLKQLEDQLQKDRDAVHAAITQYGWDSDQTDAARDQLFRDREGYRKLRRSLRGAGVAVPSPAGIGMRAGTRGYGPGRKGGGMHHGGGSRGGGMCGCPCWR